MDDRSQTKAPNAIDTHVGSRISMQRRSKGMSQTTLAEGLGITFQQVQKYEKGTNRVGASRLQAIADILSVPVSFFFEDGSGGSATSRAIDTSGSDEITQFLASAEGVALNRAFVKIQDAKTRRKFVDLLKSLAKETFE